MKFSFFAACHLILLCVSSILFEIDFDEIIATLIL